MINELDLFFFKYIFFSFVILLFSFYSFFQSLSPRESLVWPINWMRECDFYWWKLVLLHQFSLHLQSRYKTTAGDAALNYIDVDQNGGNEFSSFLTKSYRCRIWSLALVFLHLFLSSFSFLTKISFRPASIHFQVAHVQSFRFGWQCPEVDLSFSSVTRFHLQSNVSAFLFMKMFFFKWMFSSWILYLKSFNVYKNIILIIID